MTHRFPILHLLLATLLAVSPAVCLCPPAAEDTGPSWCPSAPEANTSGCCGSGTDDRTERASDCGPSEDESQTPGGGCDRCEGSCKGKTAPTMKAETPTAVHMTAPVAVPMVFGFEPPEADLVTLIRVVRAGSEAEPRPVMTLLLQHCALTI